jgi:hypothetical protein
MQTAWCSHKPNFIFFKIRIKKRVTEKEIKFWNKRMNSNRKFEKETCKRRTIPFFFHIHRLHKGRFEIQYAVLNIINLRVV